MFNKRSERDEEGGLDKEEDVMGGGERQRICLWFCNGIEENSSRQNDPIES